MIATVGSGDHAHTIENVRDLKDTATLAAREAVLAEIVPAHRQFAQRHIAAQVGCQQLSRADRAGPAIFAVPTPPAPRDVAFRQPSTLPVPASHETRFNYVGATRNSVPYDGPKVRPRHSRFWLLLVLASVIATAGIVGDSTATVIGAMIVAPLMTPLLGTMLATVVGDRDKLVRSPLSVVGYAAAASSPSDLW